MVTYKSILQTINVSWRDISFAIALVILWSIEMCCCRRANFNCAKTSQAVSDTKASQHQAVSGASCVA